MAQLGARFHGMEEVTGSIPVRSTNNSTTYGTFFLGYGPSRTASFWFPGASTYKLPECSERDQDNDIGVWPERGLLGRSSGPVRTGESGRCSFTFCCPSS